MRHLQRQVAAAATIGFCLAGAVAARADDRDDRNAFVQTNLVSGTAPAPNTTPAPKAQLTDNQLLNAWGVAFFPNGPFWIADNNSGLSTLYDGEGVKENLVVTIPPSAGEPNGTVAAPTGIVWNPDQALANEGFLIPTSKGGNDDPAIFIFDSEDGTIVAWNGGTKAMVVVDNFNVPPSAVPALNGSVYKGLALGTNATGNFLFATNFRQARIDVFDDTFAPATLAGTFSDPEIPAGFAPFGIRNVNGEVWVTYAQQNAQRHDDVAGPGNGFVDIFDTDGHLLRRFAARGHLNSPWGLAEAPTGFGPFAGDILIGDFGDGRINVYSPDGQFLDQLKGTGGAPISIDGLWTLTFGGGLHSSPETLYFTAGPGGEANGLFGRIDPQAEQDAGN
jgi:uncharacterized protein (TIGR03118 family)